MSEKHHTKYDDGEPRGDITLPVGIEGGSLLEGDQLGTELGDENGIFPNGITLCIDTVAGLCQKEICLGTYMVAPAVTAMGHLQMTSHQAYKMGHYQKDI